MSDELRQADEQLRAFALTLPEACEEFPWGERVIKVNKKIFLFLGILDPDMLRIGVKLPQSAGDVLMFPFAQPSGYNLGKHGWVSLRFSNEDSPPVEMIQDWIMESYRAVAPKKLVRQLDGS